MPRCYMVKKGTIRLGGPPPCSPTEASVAPPCYHPAVNEPRPAQYAESRPTETRYEEPRSGDFAEGRGGSLDVRGVYSDSRAAERSSPDTEPPRDAYTSRLHKHRRLEHVEPQDYARPRSPLYERVTYTVPRAVQYVETETVDFEDHKQAYGGLNSRDYTEPRPADYAGSRSTDYVESRKSEYSEPRPADYAEPQPVDYEEPSVEYETGRDETDVRAGRAAEGTEQAGEYAELQNMRGPMVREHSAADTEAAHDLLSLAASVPPLPPAAVLTVLRSPEPVLPLYTYTIQPTNIYIIADDQQPESGLYHAVQTLAPVHQVEYATVEPQVNTYIAYQEAVAPPPMVHHQIYRDSTPSPQPLVVDEPVGVPVSVIEATPAMLPLPDSTPASVQVPVIEPVPLAQQNLPPTVVDVATDCDEADDTVSSAGLSEKRGKYDCAECGKCYATSSNLSRHKQTHRSLDSQAAKRCGECGKAYVSMPALAMHVLTHRMAHVCGVCGKQFSRPWLLRGHLRSHTGEKPYNCESCGKAFADRSNLRAHLQTHSGDKKWECLRCNKTFALKSYLNKHQEAACTDD